jgi:hypothetical protein
MLRLRKATINALSLPLCPGSRFSLHDRPRRRCRRL